jgi:hypothetical protein
MLLRCESLEPRMSLVGQTRSFADVRAMSALPPEAVVERTSMDGRFVTRGDITGCSKLGAVSATMYVLFSFPYCLVGAP